MSIEKYIKNILSDENFIELEKILKICCLILNVSVKDVKGHSRKEKFVKARQFYSKYVRSIKLESGRYKYTLKMTGNIINRHHASVINHIKKFDYYCKIYDFYQNDYTKLLKINLKLLV